METLELIQLEESKARIAWRSEDRKFYLAFCVARFPLRDAEIILEYMLPGKYFKPNELHFPLLGISHTGSTNEYIPSDLRWVRDRLVSYKWGSLSRNDVYIILIAIRKFNRER
jgi:hypothetical protein